MRGAYSDFLSFGHRVVPIELELAGRRVFRLLVQVPLVCVGGGGYVCYISICAVYSYMQPTYGVGRCLLFLLASRGLMVGRASVYHLLIDPPNSVV